MQHFIIFHNRNGTRGGNHYRKGREVVGVKSRGSGRFRSPLWWEIIENLGNMNKGYLLRDFQQGDYPGLIIIYRESISTGGPIYRSSATRTIYISMCVFCLFLLVVVMYTQAMGNKEWREVNIHALDISASQIQCFQ